MKVLSIILLILTFYVPYGIADTPKTQTSPSSSVKETLHDEHTRPIEGEPAATSPEKEDDKHKVKYGSMDDSKAEIYSEDGKLAARFDPSLIKWFSKDDVDTFYDASDNLVATVKRNNNRLYVHDRNDEVVHTFTLTNENSQIYPGKGDDLLVLDSTGTPVDAYNLHTPELLTKNPGKGFISMGNFLKITYDSKGNFVATSKLSPNLKKKTK